MPWLPRTLTIYHGTVGPYANDIRNNGIQLAKCGAESDFGRGFYTTRILSQAKTFANERFRHISVDHSAYPSVYPDPQHAAVVEFIVHVDALIGLEAVSFVQPTDDWVEFIRYCRIPGQTHKSNGNYFDAAFGPVWRIDAMAHPSWEQISFHMDYPVSTLLKLGTIQRGGPEFP